jgi:hypothetical protein
MLKRAMLAKCSMLYGRCRSVATNLECSTHCLIGDDLLWGVACWGLFAMLAFGPELSGLFLHTGTTQAVPWHAGKKGKQKHPGNV